MLKKTKPSLKYVVAGESTHDYHFPCIGSLPVFSKLSTMQMNISIIWKVQENLLYTKGPKKCCGM